jgi:hypothetical protein
MTCVVEFLLNAQDEIIAVGEHWDAFAIENGAAELCGNAVIGKPLLDFVSGNVTRRFVHQLLQTVRANQRDLALDYRCDAPLQRRYMRMSISQIDGNLHFLHSVLKIEDRKQPLNFIKAPQRTKETKIRCSICNLVRVGDEWMEPETLLQGDSSGEMMVIYGVCQSCQQKLQSSLG